jgi:hypothetical protein
MDSVKTGGESKVWQRQSKRIWSREWRGNGRWKYVFRWRKGSFSPTVGSVLKTQDSFLD